jgi:hypothetical protein
MEENMIIDNLKSELQEKENELKRDENEEICLWEEERETIRREISALKKGISACEEIKRNDLNLLRNFIAGRLTKEEVLDIMENGRCEEILNRSQHKKPSDTPLQKGSGGIEDEEEQVSNPNEPTIADTQTLQTNGSLDCCSRAEIEENEKNFLICSICNNTGFLCPRTKEQRKDYEEGYKQALSNRNQEILDIIGNIKTETPFGLNRNPRDILNEIKKQLTKISEGKK